MILCVGLAADDTFLHTVAAFRRAGVAIEAIDAAQLSMAGQVTIPLDDLLRASLTLHGRRHQLADYDGAWVRLVNVSGGAPSADLKRRYAGTYQALVALFSAAPLRVVNPPMDDVSNFSKLFHAVALSRIVGWTIPRSCLTNRLEVAKPFLESCADGAIFKGASGTKTWATAYDPILHEQRLGLLPSCPVLFQERIVGPDVRLHIVGDKVFGELIESSDLDYRRVPGNRYEPIAVPPAIAAGCIELTRELGAPFQGVDFKVQRKTGEWFFLEANAMPCYQGYDRRSGGAISRAIVDWLTGARA